MKVLFSNPPWWEGCKQYSLPGGVIKKLWTRGIRAGSRWPHTMVVKSSPDDYVFGDNIPYPFFLGYAASYCKKNTSSEIYFRDSIGLSESYKKYFDYLRENKFQAIIIETATPAWEHDSKLINEILKILPKVKIVLAGPIFTKGISLIEEGKIFAIMKGEYEKNLADFLNNPKSKIYDFNFLTIDEMNSSPIPYYDDLHSKIYWDSNPHGQIPPQAHVLSSRGCPYKCIFCVWPAAMTSNDPDGTKKRTVRQYSHDYMENFLTEIIGKYKFNSIFFDDDTFNLGDKHVQNISNIMKKLKTDWTAMCRSDGNSLESWKLMKDSGCVGVKIGYESGSQRVIDKIINKKLDLEGAKKTTQYLLNIGLKVHGTFTYGLPGETKEDMLTTRRYLESLNLTSYQESGTAEIEGTPLANLTEDGLAKYPDSIKDKNYQSFQDGQVKISEIKKNIF
jgi:radical SAM superfamily enzyme YgiQ (UPF0313 family)